MQIKIDFITSKSINIKWTSIYLWDERKGIVQLTPKEIKEKTGKEIKEVKSKTADTISMVMSDSMFYTAGLISARAYLRNPARRILEDSEDIVRAHHLGHNTERAIRALEESRGSIIGHLSTSNEVRSREYGNPEEIYDQTLEFFKNLRETIALYPDAAIETYTFAGT